MCDRPCFCHFSGTECCALCQPPAVVAAAAPDDIWAAPQYKEPENSPNNAKCRCGHPKRAHEGVCAMGGCRCMTFATTA